MLARRSNRSNVNRLWDTAFWAMISLVLFAFVSLSGPALASSEKTDAKESEEPANAEPEIPETVIVPDPVSLTVLLPKSGAIRQIVFHIWLEAQSREAVPLIEHNLPKIINGFLVDLQRLMYRDTKQRFETRPAGKRSFKYSGPALLPPPPPKTEEELAAEAEAISQPFRTSFCVPGKASCRPIPCVRYRFGCSMITGRVTPKNARRGLSRDVSALPCPSPPSKGLRQSPGLSHLACQIRVSAAGVPRS